MCGLAMLYSEHATQGDLRSRMECALGKIEHRGPDEGAIWQSGQSVIGHRRLSIIDLSDSHQPMKCPNSRFVLAFNGEIYNYQDLRLSLSQRWNFKTGGDTEVLMAGLLLEGSDFLKKLKGMWAFALWDSQLKELLLSRDRFGKKPLFFADFGKELTVASEIAALRALVGQNRLTEDLDSAADYFRSGLCLPGNTIYQQVKEILPGHLARWKQGQDVKQEPYWQMQFEPYTGTIEDAGEQLKGLLKDAVSSRLVADVEVGAFLSGGVDSSLLASILVKDYGVKLKTFTIGFTDSRYDESRYAEQVAKWLGTGHYVETITSLDISILEDLVIKNIGQPFADPSLLPTALVSEVAAKQVKVAISGDGADEIFCGYQRYQAMLLFQWYFSVPKKLRGVVSRFVNALPSSTSHHSRSILKKAQLFVELAQRQQESPEFGPPRLASESIFSKLAPDLSLRGHSLPHLSNALNDDDVYQMMLNDLSVYMPQDILVKVDRASMASSLEVRSPFLDHEIVQFAFSLPRHWHRSGLLGKRMLRSTFSSYLPKDVWQRRKQGFSVPISDWFMGDLGDRLLEMLNITEGLILDKSFVIKALSTHRAKKADYSSVLWAVYIYLVWRRQT
ncbi:asparagine synthase (glutamine-hydrolyzing) [Alkalimarinus coralli]|uniref:asparagine synthase (glutamine-hydrolyzing) n=1 Tax=Alkalimarinus coralli TaxID=2935863 RepID=UPI00202B7721|nr:asparagine synthase (glutamine-hydrolyzing) [Alkalimarinus coralli]